MTAWVFEARHCPTLLNEVKETKLQTYTSPQAGINILLGAGRLCLHSYFFTELNSSLVIILSANIRSSQVTIVFFDWSLMVVKSRL
jgi:hypothetical protein